MKENKQNILILLVVGALIFLFHLSVLPVNIMEARNFVTAREMVQDGHWMLTTMNGIPRYEKPPIPTWLSAVSGIAGGIQNLNFLRLPAAFCSILLLIFFYLLNESLTKNSKFSLIASLVAATSYMIIFMGRQGTWDIFCHTFTIISIYYLLKFLDGCKNKWNYWMLSSFFLGLSILSKGPVSLYALWLPFLISYALIYPLRVKKNGLPLIISILLALIIGGSWYMYVYCMDTNVLQGISGKEIKSWANRNVKPFYHYASFVLQSGIWVLASLAGLIYPYLKKKTFHLKAYRLFFFWTIFSVILLSFIPEKKERYLLPVMIPMASTTAFFLYYLAKNKHTLKFSEHLLARTIYGLIALVALWLPVGLFFFTKITVSFSSLALSLLSVGIGVFICIQLKKKHYEKTFFSTVGFMAIFAFFGIPMIMNIFPKNNHYISIDSFKEEVKQYNLPLFEYHFYSPEFWFGYGEKIKNFETINKQNIPAKFLMIAHDEKWMREELEERYEIKKIRHFDHNLFGKKTNNYTHRLIYTLYQLRIR